MKRRITVVVAIVAATALGGTTAAEGHRLPTRIAQKAASKYGKKVAQRYIDENPDRSPATYVVDRCSRRNAHRFVCKLHVFGTDSDTGQDYDCHAFIIVQASKYDYTYATKLTDRQPC